MTKNWTAQHQSEQLHRAAQDSGADPTIRGWMQLNAIDHALQRKDVAGEKVLRILKRQ